MQNKVNLFVVGSAKCGTTSVCKMKDKEPHFFGEYSAWGEKKFTSFKSYLNNIDLEGQGIASDFSTSYLYSDTAAQEIYNYNPAAKIIIMLRDPVERAVSLFNHQIRSMREPILDFDRAVAEETARISEGWDYGFHYIQSGYYYKQVERYVSLFGMKNVLVIPFRQFVTGEYNSIIESFLDLNISLRSEIPKENKTGVPKNRPLQFLLERNFPFKGVIKAALPSSLVKKIRVANTGDKMAVSNLEKYHSLYREDLNSLYLLLGWKSDKWL